MAGNDGGDRIWMGIREGVGKMAQAEPMLARYLHVTVLDHDTLEDSLAFLLSRKLAGVEIEQGVLREVFSTFFHTSAEAQDSIRADLIAFSQRDPAARATAEPFLLYKGFHAIEAYRLSHWLWGESRTALASFLQNRISEVFAVDIHPAARIGKGLFIDHATSLVIGETAVVGDDVSMLHEVTLGGTGKGTGERHPKIGNGVLIGAGAKILGNVRVGEGSKVGAGSVVLEDVPPHTTVVGVPAVVVGRPRASIPSLQMDQSIEIDRLSARGAPREPTALDEA